MSRSVASSLYSICCIHIRLPVRRRLYSLLFLFIVLVQEVEVLIEGAAEESLPEVRPHSITILGICLKFSVSFQRDSLCGKRNFIMNRSIKTTKNNVILSNNLSTFPRFYDISKIL